MLFLSQLLWAVVGYLRADWAYLLFGILIAVCIQVYLDPQKFRVWMERKTGASVFGSVAFGAFTPLCACGTMAVLLSMFMSALPWGPVMAFLVSSPLTSPSEYVLETAVLGSGFANAMVISSVSLGLLAGWLASLLSKKTSLFKDQLAIRQAGPAHSETAAASQSCCSKQGPSPSCSCSRQPNKSVTPTWQDRLKVGELLRAFIDLGLKRVLLFFVLFIMVGKVAEMLIPPSWILSLFGAGHSYSVPLAATLGLPLYVSGSSALPLLNSLMESGAGQGAILAFMIAGKATGVPVVAGLSTIIRRKALLFYVAFVYLGAILAGYVFQLAIG